MAVRPRSGSGTARLLLAAMIAALTLGGGAASAQVVADDGPIAVEPPPGVDPPPTDGTDGAAPDPAADDGTTTTTEEDPAAGSSDARDPAAEAAAAKGGLSLTLEDVAPKKIFFKGVDEAEFHYKIAGSRARDLKIEVVDRGSHKVVRGWSRDGVEPDTEQKISWNGRKKDGNSAPKGRYFFRVREQGGGMAERSNARGDRYFAQYPHKFPVRGRHTYGDGIGAGRGHQGQDIFAECGTRLQAARAGTVQWRAYQGSGAGYYLVIDGTATGKDYVYMHLLRRGRAADGEKVHTGERIGFVGETGNASGCHLHFELWSPPGWYEGGHFLNPTRKMKAWDRWS